MRQGKRGDARCIGKKLLVVLPGEVWIIRATAEVRGRIQAGKTSKVVDEMGLIIVATPQGDVRPLHFPAGLHLGQHLLEPANAAKQFGGKANAAPERVDEMAPAQAQF